MHNQLRGSVKINADGRNLYKFINMIHCGHIYCFKQYVRNDIFYAEIYRHDLKKIQLFAEECGINLRYYEFETFIKKIIRYRKRVGLILGAIAAAFLIWYFSSIVMTIDIQGNSGVSDELILAALKELDIEQGSFMSEINFSYCEKELRIMVDGISWAGIRRTGNRLVVEVTEIVEKPEMLLERIPCNVVSDKAAQITSTSVYDGQLMRIVGDYVMPGDMLISGVIEDSTGHVTKHHAMGAITGIYDETAVFSANYESVSCIPTGNTNSRKYLKLFNLKIPLFIGKENYTSYLEENQEEKFVIFGKELPIGIIRQNLAETENTVLTYADEELENILMEKIYLYEKNFLSDINILERKIIPEKVEIGLTYTVEYTLEGEIGRQSEIFIK